MTPIGADISARDLTAGKGADLKDNNIYYLTDSKGQVVTYIECSNMTHQAARCKQYFSLLPMMRAKVWVNYRKGLLPEWQRIQALITQFIADFRIITK